MEHINKQNDFRKNDSSSQQVSQEYIHNSIQDNRSVSRRQGELQALMNNSPEVQKGKAIQAKINSSPYMVAQKKRQEELFGTAVQKKDDKTGLPGPLKSGIENLSGYTMDDVKVHYNSDKPAQLQAHAYAQGTSIHLASGQEKHLPHEAWHVVQQKQGRVKPTLQMKGIQINDNSSLEKEADEMGDKALTSLSDPDNPATDISLSSGCNTVQRVENVFSSKQTHSAPTLKEEIMKQYLDTSKLPEFESFWSSKGDNVNMDTFQKGGLPWYSQALISSMNNKNRPGNPLDVKIHGRIGNLEAELRAGITGDPYDGGHLIAYNFMSDKANKYDNVAPQGKKLNNGPFSLWEDKVLGSSIHETNRMLTEKGVRDMPHLFNYSVMVSYLSSLYPAKKDSLIKAGLVPSEHADFLPPVLNFIKRIPQHWSAHAQPLALPSSLEMGLKPGERPETPYLNDPTMDYGITGKQHGNGNFSARGPKALVSKLNYGMEGEMSEGTTEKLLRTPESLVKNPHIKKFVKLRSSEPHLWIRDDMFTGDTLSPDQIKSILGNLTIKKSKAMDGIIKNDKNFRIINSDFEYEGATEVKAGKVITAAQLKEALDHAANNNLGNIPWDFAMLGSAIEATLTLIGTLSSFLSKTSVPLQPNNANTLDFTSAEQLNPEVSNLPKYSTFRFEADDTQP